MARATIALSAVSSIMIRASKITTGCVGVLLCGALASVQAPRAEEVREPVPAAIRAHVEFLADDLLEGRGAGSRGHSLAAAYVAAQFRELDLRAAGDNGTYLQTVPLLEATPVLPGSVAKLARDGE